MTKGDGRGFSEGGERIALPLLFNRGARSVSADDGRRSGQSEELAADRGEDRLRVAAPQVGAADRAAKERVTREEDRRRRVQEVAGRAGSVAGSVDRADGGLPEADDLAVGHRRTGRGGRLSAQAEEGRLFRQSVVER